MSDSVMPGLVPGIHVVLSTPKDVDGRDKPGHDGVETGGHKILIGKRDVSAASGKREARLAPRSFSNQTST
ncbi:hypothetical protein HL666_32540 [Bradyrhizobium sp. 83002]|uniref:hypothetical protein n=1 Tax=Bradyrhizobium aeschynomenes TaxID=2734909 RepID=UPI0015539961|nr:hypothetical protein [Bradyrhizobium aeschynomenes]NPU15504.1 hypothetical protein [Bradyrhizobium aeschynomenes]